MSTQLVKKQAIGQLNGYSINLISCKGTSLELLYIDVKLAGECVLVMYLSL